MLMSSQLLTAGAEGSHSLSVRRNSLRLAGCALLWLTLLVGYSHAQSTSGQQNDMPSVPATVTTTDVPEISSQEQTTSFQVKVNLVEVRAVVRDKQGSGGRTI